MDNVIIGRNSGITVDTLKSFLRGGTHVLFYKTSELEFDIIVLGVAHVKVEYVGDM